VKNDGSFIRRLGTSTAAAAMCEAALSMAHACGMSITAECVETEEQATILREMGYQFAQGYLFGRPMPLAAAIEWLSERDRLTADAHA
jgi:EAL domain-containing protein (putative c-di-GMP-specific phosphodiesterase class I)